MNLSLEQQQIRRVVCAACRKGDVMLVGPRHFDNVMRRQMDAMGRDGLPGAEQGFIDQFGNFMSREEAWQVAAKHGQIVRLVGGQESRDSDDELYSENLY